MKKYLVLSLCLLLVTCRKKKEEPVANHPVASVPVEISIYPNDPNNFKLQGIGGWMYFAGGLRGVVVYRKSNEEFVAVERTSSHLPDDDRAKVQVMKDNFSLRDTISGSEWSIFDGTVTKGPAEWPLRLYGTSYDGNLLRIRN
jgi:hypothetical protein